MAPIVGAAAVWTAAVGLYLKLDTELLHAPNAKTSATAVNRSIGFLPHPVIQRDGVYES